MPKKRNPHTGSSFASFLEKEGIAAEVIARAAKRTFIYQLEKRLAATNSKKNKIRKALGSPTTTTRLFDEDYISLSLETMSKAARALGCELQITLVPKKASKSER